MGRHTPARPGSHTHLPTLPTRAAWQLPALTHLFIPAQGLGEDDAEDGKRWGCQTNAASDLHATPALDQSALPQRRVQTACSPTLPLTGVIYSFSLKFEAAERVRREMGALIRRRIRFYVVDTK